MLVTIVGTANHFVLDAVVGAMVVALGWRINEIMLVLRPAEEWLLWLLRTERPKTAEKRMWERGDENGNGNGSDTDVIEVTKEEGVMV